MKRLLLLLLLFLPLAATDYAFKGTHYTAQYYGCDSEALNNRIYLIAYFVKAIDMSRATLLRFNQYSFENNALTAVALLSESHASIHTYPEHNAVFVDLFTCGDGCDWRPFEKELSRFLSPTKIRRKVRCRK